MKPNQLITTMLAATALFVASCSTPQLAQNNAMQDDVYNTTASAKEYIPQAPAQYAGTETIDDSNYRSSDPYYDMDYSSRIDRFYYGSQNRAYYDPYYNYYGYNSFGFNPYRYNSFYSPYNYNIGINGYYGSFYNIWSDPYYNWAIGRAPYSSIAWGPYLFNPYGYGNGFYGGGYYGNGYYGNGYYGGGYFAGGVSAINNENYRARPNRGSENGTVRANGSVFAPGSARSSTDNSTSSTATRTRAEMYNPVNNGSNTPTRANGTSNTVPTRSSNTSESRPTRSNDTQSRPTTTQPPQQSRPPIQQSSPPPSRGESNGGRPTRGGGR